MRVQGLQTCSGAMTVINLHSAWEQQVRRRSKLWPNRVNWRGNMCTAGAA